MNGPDDETVARVIAEHITGETIAGASDIPTPHWVPPEQRVDDDGLDEHSVADRDGADFAEVDVSDTAPLWSGDV